MTASHQVDASTVDASTLFGNNRFRVPDFQRDYSWRVNSEVADFWNDLSRAVDAADDYFLGLLITTRDDKRREVVDGQQRLITLSLLANALRLMAVAFDRQLVAETLRTTFLFSIDYRTEQQLPRLTLTDANDSRAFDAVVGAATDELVPQDVESRVIQNHHFLMSKLSADIRESARPELRIGQWAEFLTHSLRFAVFDHPDRAAAFRVYEVVNTRGKILTPAELIKSYLIGNSDVRDRTYQRWHSIEQQLEDVSAGDQLTTFVRHVVALRRGYVIPRELYEVVTKTFRGAVGVEQMLADLEHHLPTYLQMIDPSADVESSEERVRIFDVLSWISATRFRPILLAAVDTGDPDLLRRTAAIVIPGVIGGGFGTGGVEAQFARAARRVHQKEEGWDKTLASLRELLPSAEEFELHLKRSVPKPLAHVLRSAVTQTNPVPLLADHVHQIRPRNADVWPGFTSDDYRELGSTLGNWLLVKIERRPPGSRTPVAVKEKLLPYAIEREVVTESDIDNWSAEYVRVINDQLAQRCREIWYGV